MAWRDVLSASMDHPKDLSLGFGFLGLDVALDGSMVYPKKLNGTGIYTYMNA